MKNPTKTASGWQYLSLALFAFFGLGTEAILAFILEPVIYGGAIQNWSVWQNICHWILTCVIWGFFIFLIINKAKKDCGFDLFEKREKMKLRQWLSVILCLLFAFTVSYMDWNGFKIIKEFHSNGLIKFIFQYIYYAFETGLFMLIIVMAQKAFEKWFKNENFPYGGIAVAITWGLGHIFTKGSISAGLLSAVGGFIFGVTYLLVNRDIKKTYLLSFIMFVF